MLRLLCFIFLMIGLSGCASSSFEVLDINALSSDRDDNGSFKGLERLAQKSPDNNKKIRVNIIYLHGIGYVENPEDAPLANAFIRGVADAYNNEIEKKSVASQCGRDNEDEDIRLSNSIRISDTKVRNYRTTLPGSTIKLTDLACMDRQVLEVSDNIEYVIYRCLLYTSPSPRDRG